MEDDSPKKVVNTPMTLMIVGGGLIILGPLLFFIFILISSVLSETQIIGLLTLAPLSFLAGIAVLVAGTLGAVVTQIVEDREDSDNSPHSSKSGMDDADRAKETSPSFTQSGIYSIIAALVLTSLSYGYGTSESFMMGFVLIFPLCLFVHLAFHRKAKTLFASALEEDNEDYFNP